MGALAYLCAACCARRRVFQSTPTDLKEAGLYSPIAIAFHEQPFREVSLALAGQRLGAIMPSMLQNARMRFRKISGFKLSQQQDILQDVSMQELPREAAA